MRVLKRITYVDRYDAQYDDLFNFAFFDEDDRKEAVLIISFLWPLSLLAFLIVLPFYGMSKLYDKIKLMLNVRNILKRIFGRVEEKSSFISVFQVDDKKSGDILGYVKAKTYESVTAGDMTKHKKTVTYYGVLTPVLELSLLWKRFDSIEPYIEYMYADIDFDTGEVSMYYRYIHTDNVKLTKIYDYEEFTFEYVK